MVESILFKQLQIVTPAGIRVGDIMVKNGRIDEVAWVIHRDAEVVIREPHLVAMPGVIDPHVHFREPGLTHKEDIQSGSRAAARGGVTSFFDMPNTIPPTITREKIDHKKQIASQTSCINYNFFMGATPANLDEIMAVENIPGIKVFLGTTTGELTLADPTHITHLFTRCPHLIAVHAESDTIISEYKGKISDFTNPAIHMQVRPPAAALASTQAAVNLAQDTHARLHICHITSEAEVNWLSQYKSPLITVEVTPQHLFLHGPEIYETQGHRAKINPPIRTQSDGVALQKALRSGVIDCIATDHAPHLRSEKDGDYETVPSGMPMVEFSLPLLLHYRKKMGIELTDIAHWMATAPSQIFGIVDRGQLAPGFYADIVLVDPDAKRTITAADIQSKCGWSVLEGQTLTGWPIATVVNGQLIVREGEFMPFIPGHEIEIHRSTAKK